MDILGGNVLIFGVFLLLLLAGVPIAFCMGLTTLVYVVVTGAPLTLLVHRLAFALDSFPVLAIPLFIFAGQLMNGVKITNHLYAFANALVGHMRGGLGHVNVLGSLFFSGMSGSALADIAGPGAVEWRAMREAGYPHRFSVGITVASSAIGPVFPPSIPAIIFAMLAEVSVARLFVGGVVPGVIIAIVLMAWVYASAVKGGLPRHPRASLVQVVRALWSALPALMTPVILLGGISLGVFSPTEAAMVTVIYATVLGAAYRELTLAKLFGITVDVLRSSALIMFIIAQAFLFSWVVSVEKLPQTLAVFLAERVKSPVLFLVFVVLLILVLGMFLENMTIMVLLVPILAPVADKIGVDLVHLGVTLIFAIALGLFTPPVGLGLYIMGDIAGMSFEETVRATLPFLIPLLVALAIIALIPQTVLFLPQLLMGR